MDLVYRIEQRFLASEVIRPGDRILVGLSGGPDSVALLCLLDRYRRERPLSLRALHVHHGIRGKGADEDEALVRRLCERRGIPLLCRRFDVPALSRERGEGLEETGRECRRRAFEEAAKEWGEGVKIALAHHMDDQAETVLFHLCRGSGLRGLGGMRRESGAYVRPLLDFTKEELVSYVSSLGEAYATDDTNLLDEAARNRIRHHVLPLLEREVSARTREHLCRTAYLASYAQDYLEQAARDALKGHLLPAAPPALFGLGSLRGEHEALKREILRLCLFRAAGREKDIGLVHVEDCLSLLEGGGQGEKRHLPHGILCEKRGEAVWFFRRGEGMESSPGEADFPEVPLPVPGRVSTPWGEVRTRVFPYRGEAIPQNKWSKWLDYDKITHDLSIRTRREGDFFFLSREGGRKLLRRFMIDEKVPARERDLIPLVAMGQEILCVLSMRLSGRVKVGAATRLVLEIELIKEEEEEKTDEGIGRCIDLP